MIDERERFERAFELFEMPEPAFERMLGRRDRKQRNRRIAAGIVGLLLVALVVGGWLGAITLDRSRPAEETPTPAPAGTVTFESPLYGYAIEIPGDWTVSPANIEWRWGESLDEGSWPPYGRDDAFSHEDGGLLVSAMAIPLDMTETAWLDHTEATISESCGEPSVVEPFAIDGTPGRLVESCYGRTIFVAAAGRGYELWGYDESLRPVIETMRLPTQPPTERPASADAFRGIWPQDTLEDAELAQAAANAGDPAYAWQTSWLDGSYEAERVATRYLEEQLGWDAYRGLGGGGTCSNADGRGSPRVCVSEQFVLRCEPGLTNPAYPSLGCAPADGNRFETVLVRLEQLVDPGRDGIWIVTRWDPLPPFEQTVPPTPGEIEDLITRFAQARIAGEGADAFLLEGFGQVPALHATSGGEPYEAFEIVSVSEPQFPSGEVVVTLRMLASGGDIVVEQLLAVLQRSSDHPRLPDGLWIEGRDAGTENGEPVPELYGILGGRVTFSAAEPWFSPWWNGVGEGDETILSGGNVVAPGPVYFVVLADPWLPQPGCTGVRVPVAELVEGILASPDLVTSEPVTTTVGGVEATSFDVERTPTAKSCQGGNEFAKGVPVVIAHGGEPTGRHPFAVQNDTRMRIYLLELSGEPAETLAIMVIASTAEFDRVVEAAVPIVESMAFGEGSGGS
jgi:hypothetical protein